MRRGELRAVFLDRDGTIVYDVGYPRDPRRIRLLPGVGFALGELKRDDFCLVLVSNQSGVGRGILTSEEVEAVHRQVVSRLREYGVQLDAAYYCTHAPEAQCRCRKPSPCMLFQAAEELGLNLAHSFMVGNEPSDIEAGPRAGCRTILLLGNPVAWELDPAPDHIARDWTGVLEYIALICRGTSLAGAFEDGMDGGELQVSHFA